MYHYARLDILSRAPFFSDLSSQALAEVNQLFHEHGYTGRQWVTIADKPRLAAIIAET